MLENDGEDQLDSSCEELKSIALSQGGKKYPAYNKKKVGRKVNWIGHILCRSCRRKRVIEGKVVVNIEVRGRRGRRRKQILDNLKEKSGYWKLKAKALYHNF